jgi:hypothetical protein
VLMSNLGQKRPVEGEDRGLLHIASSYPSRWKMGILLPDYMNVLHAATALVPYYYPWLRCDMVHPPFFKDAATTALTSLRPTAAGLKIHNLLATSHKHDWGGQRNLSAFR